MVANHLPDATVAREKISQWMDGETDAADENAAYAALKNEAGRDAWALYHHIGDVLRDGAQGGIQGGALSPGFTARVMEALEAEPTVLVPRKIEVLPAKKSEKKPVYRVWALAATLLGAVAVGWAAFVLQNNGGVVTEGVAFAEAVVEPVIATELSALESLESHVLEALVPIDYLMTHQEFLPSASMWLGVHAYQWTGHMGTFDLINE